MQQKLHITFFLRKNATATLPAVLGNFACWRQAATYAHPRLHAAKYAMHTLSLTQRCAAQLNFDIRINILTTY